MTSFAFIFGVLPLMVAEGAGAEMRRSLGMAVFSGMLGVTVFGVFLTPVFFYRHPGVERDAVLPQPGGAVAGVVPDGRRPGPGGGVLAGPPGGGGAAVGAAAGAAAGLVLVWAIRGVTAKMRGSG